MPTPVQLLHTVLGACLFMASLNVAHANNNVDTIEVSGQGSVYAVPDTLRFTMWIEAEGNKLSPLKTQVDQTTAALLRQLEERDIERKDIRSYQLSIQPRYERQGNERRQQGFQVSRQVEVVLRDTEHFDHIIDYALAQGVTRVGQIQYRIDDASDYAQKALLAAIDDAHNKAELMAKHSNRELGAIIHIQETSGGNLPGLRMAAESMAMDVSEPGQQAINARVQVTFRLQ